MLVGMNVQKRLLNINLPAGKSAFLWGPRKAGKSYWIKHHMTDSVIIDFLKTDVFADYVSRPALLRDHDGPGSGRAQGLVHGRGDLGRRGRLFVRDVLGGRRLRRLPRTRNVVDGV